MAVSAGFGLQALDEAGINELAVEAARGVAVLAGIELARTAAENALLLGEGGIERKPRRLQCHQRQIRRVEPVARGGEIGRRKVHAIDRVIGGAQRRIARGEALGAAVASSSR